MGHPTYTIQWDPIHGLQVRITGTVGPSQVEASLPLDEARRVLPADVLDSLLEAGREAILEHLQPADPSDPHSLSEEAMCVVDVLKPQGLDPRAENIIRKLVGHYNHLRVHPPKNARTELAQALRCSDIPEWDCLIAGVRILVDRLLLFQKNSPTPNYKSSASTPVVGWSISPWAQ